MPRPAGEFPSFFNPGDVQRADAALKRFNETRKGSGAYDGTGPNQRRSAALSLMTSPNAIQTGPGWGSDNLPTHPLVLRGVSVSLNGNGHEESFMLNKSEPLEMPANDVPLIDIYVAPSPVHQPA